MSSFTTTTNDPQNRAQRRLLFEGFNVHDPLNSAHRHQTSSMLTSTPDHKLYEKENELIQSNDSQPSEPCLLQLQNARQLLHSMSRTNILPITEQPIIEDQPPRSELFTEANPELAYYKSSLESERNRRKQLETLIDVQQQRLTDAESELIQLRANDHKKTLCMKQLEQMIPNVVDEWKQKETDYKTKLNNLTQQIKQIEQTNREKFSHDKQTFEEQLNEKNLLHERLTKDNERIKQDYENLQSKSKQSDQRIQQLTKDAEQAKQRWSTIETDLRNEIKTSETRMNDIQSELEKKQQEIEQILHDQHKLNTDHQVKIRQLENELDEQRRENNVLKMEMELREAKYRAQTESLKIQLIRDAETKLIQRLEEQHAKHIQIEEELNELHHRKISDSEEKYEQILSSERQEHENRVEILLNKLDQMKNQLEDIQSTTIAERQDLAKKLQDVFETALFQGSTKTNHNSSSSSTNQIKSQLIDTQIRGKINEYLPSLPLTNNDLPTNMSTIRSLSSRIDSLVDQTNRVANGFELNSRLPVSTQQQQDNISEWNDNNHNHLLSSRPQSALQKQDNISEWSDNNHNHLLSSRPQSALQAPFFRSTPIDPLQEWYPQTITQISNRSHSADPSSSGLFSTYPDQKQYQQPQSLNSFSLDSHLNTSHYRSTSSVTPNFLDHQQYVQPTISKDSIDKHENDQTNLTRYVKMLLERSPTQDDNKLSNQHPLAKTNRSLQDLQISIEQLNLAERDSNTIVDDLVLHNQSHVVTPRQHKPSTTNGGVKKRLDYDVHNNKQSNTNDLFQRLSQPKTRVKKDKPKPQDQQQQPSTGGHGVWK